MTWVLIPYLLPKDWCIYIVIIETIQNPVIDQGYWWPPGHVIYIQWHRLAPGTVCSVINYGFCVQVSCTPLDMYEAAITPLIHSPLNPKQSSEILSKFHWCALDIDNMYLKCNSGIVLQELFFVKSKSFFRINWIWFYTTWFGIMRPVIVHVKLNTGSRPTL